MGKKQTITLDGKEFDVVSLPTSDVRFHDTDDKRVITEGAYWSNGQTVAFAPRPDSEMPETVYLARDSEDIASALKNQGYRLGRVLCNDAHVLRRLAL